MKQLGKHKANPMIKSKEKSGEGLSSSGRHGGNFVQLNSANLLPEVTKQIGELSITSHSGSVADNCKPVPWKWYTSDAIYPSNMEARSTSQADW
jgi:hypothetical protein